MELNILSAEETKHRIWRGCIPVKIVLEKNEITTLKPPAPYFIMAPRMGYLFLFAQRITSYFRDFIPPQHGKIWFDFDGLPLKWNLQVGILYDILVDDNSLPFCINAHFHSYPDDVLFMFENEDGIQYEFMQSLKEATHLLYKSSKLILNLSLSERSQLWKAVKSQNQSLYEQIYPSFSPNEMLFKNKMKQKSVFANLSLNLNVNAFANTTNEKNSDVLDEDKNDETDIGADGQRKKLNKRIAFQILMKLFSPNEGNKTVRKWDEIMFRTKRMELNENSSTSTIGDFLFQSFPPLFSEQKRKAFWKEYIRIEKIDRIDERKDASTSRSDPIAETPEPSPPPQTNNFDPSSIAQPSLNLNDSEKVLLSDQDISAEWNVNEPSNPSSEKHSSDETGLEENKLATLNHEKGLHGGEIISKTFWFRGIVTVQGLELDLQTPLIWIDENLVFPDKFVKLCIKVSE